MSHEIRNAIKAATIEEVHHYLQSDIKVTLPLWIRKCLRGRLDQFKYVKGYNRYLAEGKKVHADKKYSREWLKGYECAKLVSLHTQGVLEITVDKVNAARAQYKELHFATVGIMS